MDFFIDFDVGWQNAIAKLKKTHEKQREGGSFLCHSTQNYIYKVKVIF